MTDRNTIAPPGQVEEQEGLTLSYVTVAGEEKGFCTGKYPTGTHYLSAGKNPSLCTVTDCLKTYNSKGLLVRVGYESTHEFVGQVVTNRDVCATSIARGIARLETFTKEEQA